LQPAQGLGLVARLVQLQLAFGDIQVERVAQGIATALDTLVQFAGQRFHARPVAFLHGLLQPFDGLVQSPFRLRQDRAVAGYPGAPGILGTAVEQALQVVGGMQQRGQPLLPRLTRIGDMDVVEKGLQTLFCAGRSSSSRSSTQSSS